MFLGGLELSFIFDFKEESIDCSKRVEILQNIIKIDGLKSNEVFTLRLKLKKNIL